MKDGILFPILRFMQHKSKHLKAILQFSQFDLLQTFRYANGTTENKFGAEIAEVIASQNRLTC